MDSRLDRPLMYFLDEHGQPVGVDYMDGLSDPCMLPWYEQRDQPGPQGKRVAQDDVDDYWVSTVFLSIDHQFGDGPPVLWETMVFRKSTKESDLYCRRYTSRADAERGHAEVVAALLAGTKPEDIES